MDPNAPLPTDLVERAQRGAPDAQFLLGQTLIRHERPLDALPWLKQAGVAGHVDAQAEVGRVLLHFGEGAQGRAEAVQWLRRADAAGSPAAAYQLAMIALGDLVEPRDFLQINSRMLRAAKAGFPPALRAVALYFGRWADVSSQTMAVQLFQQAAAKGDAVSALLLADRYKRGEGVPADPAQAQTLYRQLEAVGAEPLPDIPSAPLPRLPGEGLSLSFERLLEMPAPKTLCKSPHIRVHEQLLTPEECRFIIAMGKPCLRPSRVFVPDEETTAQHEVRTSHDASFDWTVEDFGLRLLQLRLAFAGGCDLVQGENLIVLRYRPGEQYRPHRDYLPPGALRERTPEAGQRRTTICCYLNPVGAGGETDFPLREVRVAPAPGRAVVFENVTPEGLPDPDSQHAGLPVQQGEKWLATLWLRQRPFRPY